MKKIYLIVATITSFFQMNTSFAGKDNMLSESSSYENYTANSRYCYKSDAYQSKIREGFYDDNLNYVTIYQDGTYSIYFFKTSVDATYYLNGVIQCHYCDNRVAVYNPNTRITEYFVNGDYADITHSGLPEGIPIFYPTPQCSISNTILHMNENIIIKNKNVKQNNNTRINAKNKENHISNKNVLFYLSMIEGKGEKTDEFTQTIEGKTLENPIDKSIQLPEQINLEEDCLASKEVPSCEVKNWAIAVKQSSSDLETSLLSQKVVPIKSKKFNYDNLDGDAKLFLKNIDVRTLDVLKQKIKKLRNNNGFYGKKNEFFDYIRAANDFRHSKNTENQLLAKYILKALLLNRNIDSFSQKLTYTYLGKIKSHNHQYEKAIHKFHDGLNVCGESARLYYFIGNNYASLEKYDKAIENWKKALAQVEKNDLEVKIKAHIRLLYCKEYHQKNAKIIHELYFKIIDLIQSNKVVTEYKDLYNKLIMDFVDYKETNDCAGMFVFKKPRANGHITKNMLNALNRVYEKHKENAFS